MKHYKYAILYLKRNLKRYLLTSLVFFILSSLIYTSFYLLNINNNSKNSVVDNIDYHATIISETTDDSSYGYYQYINKDINGLLNDLKEYTIANNLKLDYHIKFTAYDDNLSNLYIYGDDNLNDNEILVPKGFKINDQETQIGDIVNVHLSIFKNDIVNQQNLLNDEIISFTVKDIYEDEKLNGVLIINNQQALDLYNKYYKKWVDSEIKSFIGPNDAIILNAKLYRPTIYTDDFDSLVKVNDDLKIMIKDYVKTSNDITTRDYIIDSTIDDALKLINSIGNIGYLIVIVIFIVIMLVIVALYFILNIFLNERKREFAIKMSMGLNIKKLKHLYFNELIITYIPMYILSTFSSFITASFILEIIKYTNFETQRNLFIAENKLLEFEQLSKSLDNLYKINFDINIIFITFILGLAIIIISTNISFMKIKKMKLNNLLRYD